MQPLPLTSSCEALREAFFHRPLQHRGVAAARGPRRGGTAPPAPQGPSPVTALAPSQRRSCDDVPAGPALCWKAWKAHVPDRVRERDDVREGPVLQLWMGLLPRAVGHRLCVCPPRVLSPPLLARLNPALRQATTGFTAAGAASSANSMGPTPSPNRSRYLSTTPTSASAPSSTITVTRIPSGM